MVIKSSNFSFELHYNRVLLYYVHKHWFFGGFFLSHKINTTNILLSEQSFENGTVSKLHEKSWEKITYVLNPD